MVDDDEHVRRLVRDALADHRPDDPGDTHATLDVPDPVHVTVVRVAGQRAVELGYRVAWDEEHTLGARFRGGELLELCGSVPGVA